MRVLLLALMLLSLIMSAAIPEAFRERGLQFAGAYVALRRSAAAFMVYALRGEPDGPQLRAADRVDGDRRRRLDRRRASPRATRACCSGCSRWCSTTRAPLHGFRLPRRGTHADERLDAGRRPPRRALPARAPDRARRVAARRRRDVRRSATARPACCSRSSSASCSACRSGRCTSSATPRRARETMARAADRDPGGPQRVRLRARDHGRRDHRGGRRDRPRDRAPDRRDAHGDGVDDPRRPRPLPRRQRAVQLALTRRLPTARLAGVAVLAALSPLALVVSPARAAQRWRRSSCSRLVSRGQLFVASARAAQRPRPVADLGGHRPARRRCATRSTSRGWPTRSAITATGSPSTTAGRCSPARARRSLIGPIAAATAAHPRRQRRRDAAALQPVQGGRDASACSPACSRAGSTSASAAPPGTDPMTTHALQRDRRQALPDDFPAAARRAARLLRGRASRPAHPLARLARVAARAGPETPEPWLLGSSPQSAIWAGRARPALRVRGLHQPERRRDRARSTASASTPACGSTRRGRPSPCGRSPPTPTRRRERLAVELADGVRDAAPRAA